MNDLPRSPQARDSYLSHSFFKKTDAPPLQAADMLAWQSTHYFERQIDGHKIVRKDFAALIRKGDYFNFYGLDDLETLRPILASALSAGI